MAVDHIVKHFGSIILFRNAVYLFDQTTLVYAFYCVGGTTGVAVANLAPT